MAEEYESYLPRAPSGTPQVLQRRAQLFAGRILDDHNELVEGMEFYGRRFQEKWLSLSDEERADALRRADSTAPIPERRRPDFEHLRADNHFSGIADQKYRQALRRAFLTPYLNVEQLKTGNNLLMFLDSRSQFWPDVYIFSDAEQMHVNSEEFTAIPGLEMHSLKVVDGHTADTYGVLISNSELGGKDIIFPVAKGLLALEAQLLLYQTLLKILKEVMGPELDLREETIQRLLTDRMSKPEVSDKSFEGVISRTAYRPPNTFEPVQLDDAVGVLLNSKKEELSELMSNPVYFKQKIESYKVNQKLSLRLARNKLRKEGLISHKPSINTVAHWQLLQDGYDTFHHWHIVKACFEAALPLFQNLDKKVEKEETRSERYQEFHDTFLDVDVALLGLITSLLGIVRRAVTCLPALMKVYKDCPNKSTELDTWDVSKAGLKAEASAELQHLHRLFSLLLDDKAHEDHGLYRILDELQLALADDRAGKQHVTAFAVEAISELHLAVGISNQLQAFQPHQSMWRQRPIAIFAAKKLISGQIAGILEKTTAFVFGNELKVDDSSLQWSEGDKAEDEVQRTKAKRTLHQWWSGLAYALSHTDVKSYQAATVLRKPSLPLTPNGHGISSLDLEMPFKELYQFSASFLSQLELDSEAGSTKSDGSPQGESASDNGKLPLLQELSLGRAAGEEAQDEHASPGQANGSKQSTPTEPVGSNVGGTENEDKVQERPLKSWENSSTVTGDKPSRFKPEIPSKKMKRRKETPLTEQDAGDGEQAEPEPTPATPDPISVDRDTYHALDFMLSLTGTNLRAEIKWTDVVGAMVNIGFEAIHLAGSIWMFSHETFGRINAHEPHPRSKWDWWQARWFGGRLKRNFGFGEDTFVQA